ncbi:hypothetical protein K7X08_036738 [Anisodus acutangulus]|uniref:Uncharacterized protein n=1 Tax=Anisodus acutangulus TaxID=402998 RepID=A0A9Q1QX59_9SOLA|nr:hypothetical protein K7X08_036738 [Anisodus acutangulus]
MLDITELIWCCVLAKKLQKVLAILLGCMSASILFAEATILPSGVDLSLFSILINAMEKHEMLVQLHETKPSTRLKEEDNVSHSKPLKGEAQHESSKEEIIVKYKTKRARQMKRENSISSNGRSRDRPSSSWDENSMMDMQVQPSRGLSSTWRSMQTSFRNFKSNMELKGFIPLHQQVQDMGHPVVLPQLIPWMKYLKG